MYTLPSFVTAVFEKFNRSGFKIYLVGGTVRGLIMNKKISDWDFTTDATPEDITKLYDRSFYNNSFGTVGIPYEDKDVKEVLQITTFRKESKYSNARHPDTVLWTKDINEDLARRDFTINAIAYDGENVHDPYNGIADIKNKIIRCVGNPDIRFKEDALRLLRAVRQATQLQFQIEEKTLLSIKLNSSNICNISGERIKEELFKLILTKNADSGIRFLKETNLLSYILPELNRCWGVDQKSPERHHKYDVYEHSLKSLSFCSSTNPVTKLATLLHDIGKADTYNKDLKTGIITFYNHEIVGENLALNIANRLKFSSAEKTMFLKLIRFHQFTVTEDQSDKAIKRFIRNVGIELIDEMLELRRADRLGSDAKETSWRTELFKKRIIEVQKTPFTVSDLKITGYDVMNLLNIKPGIEVGLILKKLFDEVEDNKLTNIKEALLKRLKEIKKTN